MQNVRLRREVLILLGVVVALYLACFYGMQYLRTHKGAWRVQFLEEGGRPVLVVSQPGLKLEDVRLEFPEEKAPATNLPVTLTFEQPIETPFDAPFGQVVYEDLTFLPGAVTLHLFGHEVEMLPRTLILDRHEHGWKTGETIQLWATNKIPDLKTPKDLRR